MSLQLNQSIFFKTTVIVKCFFNCSSFLICIITEVDNDIYLTSLYYWLSSPLLCAQKLYNLNNKYVYFDVQNRETNNINIKTANFKIKIVHIIFMVATLWYFYNTSCHFIDCNHLHGTHRLPLSKVKKWNF